MTRENDQTEIVRKVVVVFDISSSTTILEELKRCDRLDAWRNLLINLKNTMRSKGVEIYKFMGDGWIIFFPFDVSKEDLLINLNELSTMYFYFFQQTIEPLIPERPEPLGLTAGIDSGELIRMEMNEKDEFIGRPINVAARLQGRAKEFGSKQYTNVALISRPTYNSLLPRGGSFDEVVTEKTVELKNISGGENFRCFLLGLVT